MLVQTVLLEWSQVDGERMARLVDSDLAAPGQPEAVQPSPTLLGDVLGELDALRLQIPHRGFQVVAHEVQLVPGRTFGRVQGQFRGRQLEDQPATASVDVAVSEHVSEEVAIRFRIAAEHDDVAAHDHVSTLRGRTPRFCSRAIACIGADDRRRTRYRRRACRQLPACTPRVRGVNAR